MVVNAWQCMLFNACCSIHVVQCVLFSACCSMRAVQCMLLQCMVFSACCSMHVVQCMVFNGLHSVRFWCSLIPVVGDLGSWRKRSRWFAAHRADFVATERVKGACVQLRGLYAFRRNRCAYSTNRTRSADANAFASFRHIVAQPTSADDLMACDVWIDDSEIDKSDE